MKKTVASVIAHPVRVQILTIANERPISPSRYVEEVMGFDPVAEPADYKRGLSHVSYHFRELEKAGCIEATDFVPKRGAVEHIYRAVTRAILSDEEWEKVPMAERSRVMTVAWQGLMGRTEAARLAHTLEKRDDAWLAWTEAKLDEHGWAEMTATLAASFAELEQIRRDAEERLGETGGLAIPSTFSLMGFESPSGVFWDALPGAKTV